MRQTRHATKKRIMALLLSVLMLIALAAPEAVMAASRKKKAVSPSVQYAVTQYGYGWTGYLSNGQTAGRTNKARRLEMVRVRLRSRPVSGGVQYRSRYTGGNWSGWVNEDRTGGKNGCRMEGIRIRLTGNMARRYDVWYRVCTHTWGWTGWAKNGSAVGTEGYACYLTGLQVRLTRKGSRAPGSTRNTCRKKTYPALVNKAMRQKQGSKGRLVIPDLGISVTLRNASKGNAAYMQRLADWNDAAAWIDLNELTGDRNKYQVIIADHAKQGFKNLSRAKKGRTMAYIVTGRSVTAYRCVRSTTGTNKGSRLVDYANRSVMQENIGGFCTYTCVGSRGNKIVLAEWKKA